MVRRAQLGIVLEEEGRDGLVYMTGFFILLFLGSFLGLKLLIGLDACVFWTYDFLCYGKFPLFLGFSHDKCCCC